MPRSQEPREEKLPLPVEPVKETRHRQDEIDARVLRYISPLIVPAAGALAACGAVGLECLVETINEGWKNSIPLAGICPQPTYSVGFRREAFSGEQLAKLSPFLGDYLRGDLSYFMDTHYMCFPFLACEAKCGMAALDLADDQNSHSMTIAARGIVKLFRLVRREGEVHRRVVAFSISHDHQSARIYGYYPVIDGEDTKYYRHPIQILDLTSLDGKDRWTAYRFTKTIYDTWMPEHLRRIRSAIDQLPLQKNFTSLHF